MENIQKYIRAILNEIKLISSLSIFIRFISCAQLKQVFPRFHGILPELNMYTYYICGYEITNYGIIQVGIIYKRREEEEEEDAIRLRSGGRRRRRNEYTSIFQKNYVVTFWFEFCALLAQYLTFMLEYRVEVPPLYIANQQQQQNSLQ